MVALLVPEPAATELDGLRRALGAASLGRIAPHLTLVPPRNVAAADQPAALELLRAAAGRSAALRLSLGPPASFAPRTPVVFLTVGGDLEELSSLRNNLALAPLAPPPEREPRDFVPHVTLTGGADAARAALLVEAIRAYNRVVSIDRVTLLEQDEAAPRRPWRPIAEAMLGRPTVVGRGGVELELRCSGRLDPEEQTWLEIEWSAYRAETYGPAVPADEPVAVVARAGGEIVGIAVGSLRPELLHLHRLIVARAERNLGVGAQLMRMVERLAVERGAAALRLEPRAGGPAERFYERLGFARIAEVPRHRGGADFSVMERRLPGGAGR
ncbi:MAG TPA: GNAT family N-acetyltransferase [Acidimicrobiales bacterium]|nr:GNAT family N-acetyltransferase [Acidimicrobiales bacterium]